MIFFAKKSVGGVEQPIVVFKTQMRLFARIFVPAEKTPCKLARMTTDELQAKAKEYSFACFACVGGVMFVKPLLVGYTLTEREIAQLCNDVAKEWGIVFADGVEATVDVSAEVGSYSDEYDSLLYEQDREHIKQQEDETSYIFVRNETLEQGERKVLDLVEKQLALDGATQLSNLYSTVKGKDMPALFVNYAENWNTMLKARYQEAKTIFDKHFGYGSSIGVGTGYSKSWYRLNCALQALGNQYNATSQFAFFDGKYVYTILPEKEKLCMLQNPSGYTALLVKYERGV